MGTLWGVSPLQWGHPRTPSPSLPVPGQGWVGLGCRMGAEHQPSPLCRAQGTHETQTVLCAQGIFLIPHPCAGTQQTRVPKAGSGKSCSRRDWGPIQDGGIQLRKKLPSPLPGRAEGFAPCQIPNPKCCLHFRILLNPLISLIVLITQQQRAETAANPSGLGAFISSA